MRFRWNAATILLEGQGPVREDSSSDVLGVVNKTSIGDRLPIFKFSKLDGRGWWLAVCAGALAFLVYWLTLAPGLTFANDGTDGGDLIAAARTLGIPHPTGYPTYTLLAWLFTHMPVGVIAYRVNLLSAVCAAISVGLVLRVAQSEIAAVRERPLIAFATALSLAFSSLVWSQAVISEVYALLGLFSAVLLLLLVRWRAHGRDWLLWLASFTLGLGLGNHLTLVFVVPAALVLLWSERGRWCRVRILIPSVILFLLGLSVYVYLPLAAQNRPPVNWGNPQTWKGFLWVVTAKQYQPFAFGLEPAAMPVRAMVWAGILGDQFGWWGLALALAGAWSLWQRDRHLAKFAMAWMLLIAVYAFLYDTGDSHVYLVPAVMLMALWWGEGAAQLVGLVRLQRREWLRWVVVAVLLLPVLSLALHWRAVRPDDDWQAHAFVYRAMDVAEPGSVIVVRADGPTFALWYGLYAEEVRTDVSVINGPLLAYYWYRDNMRHLYPHLILNEPGPEVESFDDLVYDLVVSNRSRTVYAVDPKEEWQEWANFEPVEGTMIQRVDLKAGAVP